MADKELVEKLKEKAKKLRREIIEVIYEAQAGHPGGSLSEIDILSVLFLHHMKINPQNIKDPDRDRFILSKGHATPGLYTVMAEAGFFPKDELHTFRKINSRLSGHASKATPGIEINTGSLGQGLSIGNGMALAGRLDNKDYRVFVLMGDGELQEGQVWEAAKSAAHYKLDKVIAIVDRNGLQQNGPTEELMKMESLAEKWKAFGWDVLEIDGHEISEIIDSLNKVNDSNGKPNVIIAKTVKGKGVSFMENNYKWHGKAPDKETYEKALAELS